MILIAVLFNLVDEIIYDVLDVFNGENDEETLKSFAGRYSDEDIREVLAELHELKDEGPFVFS